jgi:predicted acylesterase/phospholipase RssA
MDLCYLSHENYPELELWMAIRMSSSFPFYFCPILYKNKYYIDGGAWDNYPCVVSR